jgi:GDP/UDP-N,N'-diacetylbacillosamine 2-epimerase (hydrolysing)
MIGFADALNELNPDLIVVLGDRFEVFSAVSAALVAKIPVAHLHGGEKTEGAFDESLRHSITKMSHLHFVAAESYRQRVIQLGEDPDKVFLVGGLGVDSIKRLKLLNKEELETALDFKLGLKNLLITFHPVTLEKCSVENQMAELLGALANLRDTQLIFTLPNADTNGRILLKMVQDFVGCHNNSRAYNSLGQLLYFSCISQVDGVVGNSSSGLLEAPTFKKGVINIGDRQLGRMQARNVINCEPNRESISSAFLKLYSSEFQESLNNVVNPYGDGGASEKIVKVIKKYTLDDLVKKHFFDLPINNFVESA